MAPAHTYKTVDLVGTSPEGVTEAIEVGPIRGEIVDGRIAWYQVAVKIGFRVMSDEELKAL